MTTNGDNKTFESGRRSVDAFPERRASTSAVRLVLYFPSSGISSEALAKVAGKVATTSEAHVWIELDTILLCKALNELLLKLRACGPNTKTLDSSVIFPDSSFFTFLFLL